MAESLIRLGKDPGLARRLSEAGRRKIEKSFHSRRSAEVLLQCIQDGKPFGNGAP
jgi:hypothetical protein